MIELCTKCHEDEVKMKRHGLETVSTFRDTFHWQSIKFGDPDAPNCITCHAPVGYLSHDIKPRTDPRSAIHKDNLVRTCSNPDGFQNCHPGATRSFAEGRVHPPGFKVGLFNAGTEAGDVSGAIQKPAVRNLGYLVTKWFSEKAPQKATPGSMLLFLIKYFYMLLIGGLISFMIIHQFLDFLATRRERNQGGPH